MIRKIKGSSKAYALFLAGNALLLSEAIGRNLSWFILDLMTRQAITLAPFWFYRGVFFAWNLLGAVGFGLILLTLFTGFQRYQPLGN